MELTEIGRMVYILRTEKKISQEELCNGICSIATLSRFELGERRPDILIFNALFQRLGKSADHINTVLTLEEFEYFAKRRNIEIALSTKDYKQAEEELQILESELLSNGISLQRQDIYRIHAILYIHRENNYEQAEKYVQKALLETIRDFEILKEVPTQLANNLWLCESEIQLLLMYIYIKSCLGIEEALLLENVISYIRLKITDEKAKTRLLAKALHMQAYIYKKSEEWEKCYKCSEAVIEAEVKNGAVAILFQALKMEMQCLENGILVENGELRKKQYFHLKTVIDEYGKEVSLEKFAFFLDNTSQEKSLIDEVIRYSRLRGEYSQEEFSEGICTPETLSRIETGKRNPTLKNFYALMKKSGVEIGYYNTEIIVDKFETLEKVEKLKQFSVLGKYEEMEKVLKELEIEIDISKNLQQIKTYHIVIDYRLGKITLEEALKQIEEALELSLEKVDGKFKIAYLPTSTEISLMNQIAVYYRIMGQRKQAVEILTSLYEQFQESRLEAPERNRKYFMVIGNLASFLEEIDEVHKAIEILDESLNLSIKYNIGLRIGSNLIAKAFCQERIDNHNCIMNYESGYYLCGLFGDLRNQNNAKKHVLEKWQVEYES